MAEVFVLVSGGGGVASADVTATKADVLAGYKTLTADSNDEIAEGELQSQAGQTITPTKSTQRISCAGKYMAQDVIVNRIPTNYVKI